MAITNAQQFKQLVNPPMDGKRPGYRGDDAAFSTGAAQMGRADPGTRSGGPSGGPDKGGRDDVVTADTLRRNQLALDAAEYKRGQEALNNLKVSSTNFPAFFPGSTFLNIGLGATTKFRQKLLDKNVDYFKSLSGIENKGYPKTAEGYKEYMKDRLAGKIDAAGNPLNTGDNRGQTLPIIPQTISNMTDDAADADADANEKENVGRMFRLLADGGMTEDAPVGGIMDIESGRQMYGLGKLVKKATRAVKKIVKSPVGKAALLYGGFKGFQALGGAKGIMGSLFGQAGSRVGQPFVPFKEGLLTKLGLTKGGGSLMPTAMGGIALASLTPLLFNQQEEDDEEDIDRGPPLEIDRIRANPYLFTPRRFAAEGGSMKEPVAKKTMPLIDMDGKEKYYRETGGFVDMGRMERADDVPARLSKNEFVFTADAVRNAGDGSVDKGAEVMYNMMKNLEAGGDVSEESQGLDGARKMFQTSQRLGEVL